MNSLGVAIAPGDQVNKNISVLLSYVDLQLIYIEVCAEPSTFFLKKILKEIF